MSTAGIYSITCRPTQDTYIGGSTTVSRRMAQHRRLLRKSQGATLRLQRLWDQFGEEAFEFRRVLVCRPEDVELYEQLAIDALNPTINARQSAGTKGAGAKHGDARTYEVRGEQLSASEIARKYNLKLVTVKRRIACGDTGDALIRLPHENRATRHLVRGERLRLSEIAARYGIDITALQARVRRGWEGDELIAPVQSHEARGWTYLVFGEPLTVEAIAKKYKIPYSTVYKRLQQGLRDDALVARRQ